MAKKSTILEEESKKVIKMAYYHQTLQKDTSITHAAYGNFTDQVDENEIAISTGRFVKLLRYHWSTNHIEATSCLNTFSRICSMKKFWCEKQQREHLFMRFTKQK
ncbi:hypothetical protein TNIN_119411 [Trichonephila inaurata madagascariensis]|uniref:Uncharacterized protein n=1 Tax=Trichonephila inaurata madagascariensis TaxID=2747483 RepID=A0A8X7BNF7_9ARAC|nr:hypothetical protein TNIN_119411 [Trichonephila inaurata madagascariensis]